MRVRVPPPAPETPAPKPLRPPLKWAGGKRWLLPLVQTIWTQFESTRYVEPFCGGLAIALGLQPKRALLNDLNPHLISFYRQLQRGMVLNIDARYDKDLFYKHRARFNEYIRDGNAGNSQAAQLFYFLNRTCFNGLCRFNRHGEFNVPFGRYKSVNYLTDFSAYRERFRPWTFTNVDLEQLPLDSSDFIYADPPYDVEFTTYSAAAFTWNDQIRTAEFFAKHRGPVLLSNQATPRIVRLYRKLGYKLKFVNAPRRISSNGDRNTAREVIASRNV